MNTLDIKTMQAFEDFLSKEEAKETKEDKRVIYTNKISLSDLRKALADNKVVVIR